MRCISNNFIEAHSFYKHEWRPSNRPPHAHNTIRYAQQVQAAEEADVLVLGGLPQARLPREASTGMDLGVVCTYSKTDLKVQCLISGKQRNSIRSAGAKRIREGKYSAIPVRYTSDALRLF